MKKLEELEKRVNQVMSNRLSFSVPDARLILQVVKMADRHVHFGTQESFDRLQMALKNFEGEE